MTPYPLIFTPILKDKVWGGRLLERFGKALPETGSIGESWELADLPATSPDGGGGGAARSVIANGEMRGLSIADAVIAMGPNLMGRARLTDDHAFPLLVKLLDARQNLSVQVHPSPAYAATHPEAHLKTESWYILHAEPDAVIYKGVQAGVTKEEFAKRIADGTVADVLIRVPVHAGDFHHLPSGTCHALGAGVVLAEVQVPSDTTFRVFDWGREGRTLHVAEALECIEFGPPERTEPIRSDGSSRFVLEENPHYILTELRANAEDEGSVELSGKAPRVWMVLHGEGVLSAPKDPYAPVHFKTGQTLLLPAGLPPSTCYIERDSVILEVRLPIADA